MNVEFKYLDFDGEVKTTTATVVVNGEWHHAQNLELWGCGKKVSSVLAWHPVRAALKDMMGGREIVGPWKELKAE